jgi:hypothetical protein
MGRRSDPVRVIWADGPAAFEFLVSEYDFLGPERTDEGLAYHRPDLRVEITHWEFKNEAGFSTTVSRPGNTPGSRRAAQLDDLFVACGLGPSQAVPGQSGAGHTIRKRIAQHAKALRQVMPRLDEVLRRPD